MFFSASDVIPHDRTRIPIFAQRAISTAAQAFPLQPRSFSTAAQAFQPQPRSISTAAQEPGPSKTKCQHLSSLISSIKKRNFVFFERVPMTQLGFEPRTFCIEGESLIHYSIEKVMLRQVRKDNVCTQRGPKGIF